MTIRAGVGAALVPAGLICGGALLTAIAVGIDHTVTEGMACTAVRPEPVWSAVLMTSAVVVAVTALITAGRLRRSALGTLCISSTVVAMVGTVFLGSVAGPRVEPEAGPITGFYYAIELLGAVLIAGTVFGLRAVRRDPLSAAWIPAGLLLIPAVAMVAVMGDWLWFTSDALRKVCMAG